MQEQGQQEAGTRQARVFPSPSPSPLLAAAGNDRTRVEQKNAHIPHMEENRQPQTMPILTPPPTRSGIRGSARGGSQQVDQLWVQGSKLNLVHLGQGP